MCGSFFTETIIHFEGDCFVNLKDDFVYLQFTAKQKAECMDIIRLFLIFNYGFAIGRSTVNVLPIANSLFTLISPPQSSTILFAMDKPSPSPCDA